MGDGGPAWDYIVVGAGTAGCVVAARISEDPRLSVLVLESGARSRDPLLAVPKALFYIYGRGKHSFTYRTEAVGPGGGTELWQRGRVLGGSSAINGMQYLRGGPSYWDGLGLPGWDWRSMLAIFRALENHELGAAPERGVGGPLDISVTRERDELNEAIIDAAVTDGLRRVDDLNASEDERVGYIPNTIRRGTRVSAARAFLTPALGRKNLDLITRAHADSLLLRDGRVVGVRAGARELAARRAVIVAAGAIETPLLIERSGIGRPDVLERIGVPVAVASPSVGEHAIEQRQVLYQATVRDRIGYGPQLWSAPRRAAAVMRYGLTRRGVLATGAYEVAAYFKSSADATYADIMALYSPLALDLTAPKLAVATEPGFYCCSILLSPTTAGSVHSSGSDPSSPPVIAPRYLESEYDREAAFAGLRRMRAIAARAPLREKIAAEQAPGADVRSPADAVAAAWASGHILHLCGTMRMGSADDDPVDPQLRVRGVQGLMVADASVLPRQPGNTMAPALAVGWRAADLIAANGYQAAS